MRTDFDHAAGPDPAAALSGILALLVAEREERAGRGARRTERILARTGLSDDQIAALTGHDAARVRTLVADDAKVARPAREPTVIDRARAVLTRGPSTNGRAGR
jgi:hypothetical protein